MNTLHFEGAGNKTSQIEVTKQGRVWTYFTAKSNRCKYRVNNNTGEVQVAPYWCTSKMYVD